MNWQTISEILETHLLCCSQDQARTAAWFTKLKTTPEGRLLGICIAIDLLAGAIKLQAYATIIDRVQYTSCDARLAFARALASHPKRYDLICASSLPCPKLPSKDRYVRVLTLRGFVDYYLRPTYGYCLDVADLREARRRYFGKYRRGLADIALWWTGS